MTQPFLLAATMEVFVMMRTLFVTALMDTKEIPVLIVSYIFTKITALFRSIKPLLVTCPTLS